MKTRSLLPILLVPLFFHCRGTSADAQQSDTTYPLAHLVANRHPILGLDQGTLESLMVEDVQRLTRASEVLLHALQQARTLKDLWSNTRPEELGLAERARIREVWWQFLDGLLEADAIKHRYRTWFASDYMQHPRLHSRAFALAYAALCIQFSSGQELMALVVDNERVQVLLNEANPDGGIPGGVFHDVRYGLARNKDLSVVPMGAGWYATWIEPRLGRDGTDGELRTLVHHWKDRALGKVEVEAVTRVAKNKLQIFTTDAFAKWMPVQRGISEWAGDTRLVPENRRLISDQQVAELKQKLRPGDILVERRNWYLSNVGLPGFWPHAALYAGTQDDIKATFDGDAEVKQRFGVFSEHLEKAHPEAWTALGQRDEHGKPRSTLEATGMGVSSRSLEHSCGADYAAAMRPRLPLVRIAEALDRAMAFFGRPYDFNFDFATDDALVCSELVIKAYGMEPGGLSFPFVTVAERRVVAPTDMVRLFANQRGRAHAQLDFVAFLEGVEHDGHAVWASEEAFAATANRPKWNVVQR